ncbi:Rne/Rng family ribonuclease [Alkalicoccus daliensis]|uniref:Ribonuclease G n=1 Tax=Alkalicoccus daliensis TaxID=745820 RepID=A0A1H0CNK6_9BACI|nr:Rne/Rng family ribonuclease [Alkalicoccus daliensis]SDN59469.1 ribonuclease G [Alkalicoccus daliensis]
MNRQVVIEKIREGHRGAVLENEKVQEWMLDDPGAPLQDGMILSGKVSNVIGNMEAAFIDIGAAKHGYLHKKEHPAHQQWKISQEGREPNISSLLQPGDKVLVQVKKEAAGTKGATLTMLLNFPGNYVVFMPYGGYAAISKKLDDEKRSELRTAAKTWLRGDEGLIVRTNAGEQPAEVLEKEFYALKEDFEALAEQGPGAPGTIHLDQSSVVSRTERDFLTDGETEILTNDASLVARWKRQHPETASRIHWRSEVSLFITMGLDRELEKALRPFAWMKNGASLMIEQTEAMTIIDVNSAKYTGKGAGELSGTAKEVNLAAALEIARQLRLRNIGGIIIIDFIDMKTDEEREEVLSALKRAVKLDRTITNVIGFTGLGYVEMTRKQSRRTLEYMLTDTCDTCGGAGRIVRNSALGEDLHRTLLALDSVEAALIDVSPRFYRWLLREGKERVLEGVKTEVVLRENPAAGHFQLARTGTMETLRTKGDLIQENN